MQLQATRRNVFQVAAATVAALCGAGGEGHEALAIRETPDIGLIEYMQRMNPRYQASAVHYFLASKLEACFRREIKRLIISYPPRHGKTELASVGFPAWVLGQEPEAHVMGASYSATIAGRNSRKARNQLTDPRYPYATRLAGDRSAIMQWATREDGEFNAAGTGGAQTGMGADFLLIDDYIKNLEEADSEDHRQKVYEWYTDVAYPRLHADGVVIIIATRWHEDDLIGRLLKDQANGGEQWETVILPAIAEYDPERPDPLGRAVGEPLWPERFPIPELLTRKRTMSSRSWQAQYQAKPVATEGGMYKRHWWKFWHYHDRPLPPVVVTMSDGTKRYCESIPKPNTFDEMVQSWDMTFGDTDAKREKNDNSYVVGQVWGRQRQQAYLLDQYRGQVEFVDSLTAFRALTAVWPSAGRKYVEKKANGAAVISSLHKEIPGIVGVEPKGSKTARAEATTPFVESGNTVLPHPMIAPWVQVFIDEHASFPAGDNDDQVDAQSQALHQFFLKNDGGTVTTESYATWSGADDDDPWGEE